MTTQELLSELLKLDIKLWVDGERLRYNAPQGAMTPELQAELVKHKSEIIRRLQSSGSAGSPDSPSILPVERPAQIPLSFAQQRLWFVDQLEPGSSAYNMFNAVRLGGPLDVDALEQGYKQIVQRHEALRTTFKALDGQPQQIVTPSLDVSLPLVDLSALPQPARESEVQRLIREEGQRPFDLSVGPLVRCSLLRLADDEHILLLTMHHIVSDVWSMGVLFHEIVLLGQAYAAGRPSPLAELPLQYADFAIWQRNWLQGEILEKQIDYWKKQLAGAPAALELPTDYPRPALQTYRGARLQVALPRELSEALQTLSHQEDTTLFMVLLAAFQVLLSRYSRQTDIVVGSPVANRSHTELETLIGFFINTLVLRTDLSGSPSFRELLKRVRDTCLGAYDHQDVPFEKLVDELQVPRDLSRNPLFQAMFVLQNAPTADPDLAGLIVEPLDIQPDTSLFDLRLSLQETGNGLAGILEYSTDLFTEQTVQRLFAHFECLLAAIVANPGQSISELPLLAAAEQQQILRDWNATQTAYPQDKLIHQLVEDQARSKPEAVALSFEGRTLTYRELNERANQLARFLQTKGVGPETLVGICIERSLEMVVGLLGILKAGGAYVPLDPGYPAERLAYMLKDADVSILLTQAQLLDALPEHAAQIICLDRDWESLSAGQSTANCANNVTPAGLAYMIYTSGSTGRPKGAMNTHLGILNRLLWMQEAYGLTDADRVLQKTPFSFDVSVWEFFWPLMTGARLVIAQPEGHKDSAYLVRLIGAEQITTLHFVPSMLRVFLEEPGLEEGCTSLKRVICSGEALPYDLQEKFFARLGTAGLHNLYGPTEAAVDVTYWACLRDGDRRSVPIGRPIANTQIYILDENLRPVPVGVPGELYIGGTGVGRGYYNRPNLTAEKFIPDPFTPLTSPHFGRSSVRNGGNEGGGNRLYRTGDLARWLPDASIEYLGRLDFQVKLRGFRIELGEIEAALGQHPGVNDAVAVVREDTPGHKQLVAYLVTERGAALPLDELRAGLKARLPEYMVPGTFVFLEALPLSPSGKTDRKALPAPSGERPELSHAYVAPRTPAEASLASVWAGVLGLEQVGVQDNFFELGGDSILGLQVIARAHQAGLHLTPRQLFQHQTVAELAAVADTTPVIQAEQGPVTGPVPLTPIQHWFFEQDLPDPQHWNQALLLDVQQPLDPALLEKAVRHLLLHHDALRLRFERTQAGWQQTNAAPDDTVPFRLVDLTGRKPAEQGPAIAAETARLQTQLDLGAGPLMQVAYFDLGRSQPARLFILIHHLAVDGVSWRILLEDLQTAYGQLSQGRAVVLPAKSTSFQEWAGRLAASAQPAELDYWLNQPWQDVAALPVDHPKTGDAGWNLQDSIDTVTLELNEDETRLLLQSVPEAYRTQINDVLLAALGLALARWTGRQTLLVDLEGHGREELFDDLDISRTVGWFTSLFPLLLQAGPESALGETLKGVKEQLRQLPRRGVGYGLLRYLNADPNVAGSLQKLPAAEIIFNYLGQLDQALGSSAIFAPAAESSGPMRGPRGRRAYLLEVNASVLNGKLQVAWIYSRNVHEQRTIEQVAQRFAEILRALMGHCLSAENGGYTPSDFPLAKLGQPELDELFGSFGRAIEDIYPLTPMQQGMLFHTLAAPESGVYVEQISCAFPAGLDVPAFEKAWARVLDRHAILRSAFRWEGAGEPYQIVYRQVDLPIEQPDWRKLPPDEQARQRDEYWQAQRRQGFDLSSAPLMRLRLTRISETSYLFDWAFHHLLLDGWSWPLLMKEVFAFYEAFSQGQDLHLPVPRSFGEYVAWLQRQDGPAAAAFWQQVLRDFSAPTPLGLDRGAASRVLWQDVDGEYAEHVLSLPAELTAALQNLARHQQLTLNTLMQGAWALLLSRYSGEQDVLFGATVSGRPPELSGSEQMMGMFINSLPVRVGVRPESRLLPWLKELQAAQVEMRQYEYSALSEVQAWSGVPRGQPLFESLMIFENYPVDSAVQEAGRRLAITDVRMVEQTNYPLSISVVPGRELSLRLNYARRRFDDATIAKMAGHFQVLLAGMAADPDSRLSTLPYLTDAERRQLLHEWNDTARALPEIYMPGLFEKQAVERAEDVAVVFEGTQLTYAELNRRANRLAHYLRGLGVGPDVLVGIYVERSLEMLIGLLGILKAGGAYVPLDPTYPQERLAYMLADARPHVVLTQAALLDSLPQTESRIVQLDAGWDKIEREKAANPKALVCGENLAYVIYTSGSTGKPKGVQLTHRGLLNFLETMKEQPGFTAEDVLLSVTTISFDIAGLELYLPLCSGGQVVIANQETAKDGVLLARILAESNATLMQATPATWRLMLDSGWQGKPDLRILCGGEAFPEDLARELLARSGAVWNMYGPTETTVWSTLAPVKELPVTLGRPVANTHVYVLDPAGNPVPVGVAGEIHIGGTGLARGYRGRPELTAERFVPDGLSGEAGERLYRTGDLGRYLADGRLEFLGRIDTQVKVRGYRIELGEIETVLRGQPGVKEAVVITWQASPEDEARLVAYVIMEDGAEEDARELLNGLKAHLPAYMLPSLFRFLRQFPLTPNGKIDRKALPHPTSERASQGVPYVAPSTPVEEQLAAIWREVLKIEKVGIHENFFEAGGTSIMATQVISRVRNQFHVEIPLARIFEASTIAQYAELIVQARFDQMDEDTLARLLEDLDLEPE